MSASSPIGAPATATAATTIWAIVTVNQGGPIENAGGYVMLTDSAGSFKNTWFYVPPLIASMVNQTTIAAITTGKKVYVELTGSVAASSVMRFHLIA
jgi:hypothetical protein